MFGGLPLSSYCSNGVHWYCKAERAQRYTLCRCFCHTDWTPDDTPHQPTREHWRRPMPLKNPYDFACRVCSAKKAEGCRDDTGRAQFVWFHGGRVSYSRVWKEAKWDAETFVQERLSRRKAMRNAAHG